MASLMKRALGEAGWKTFSKMIYGTCQFPKLGMMRHDALGDTELVAEAVSRLPKDLQAERQFRITRALYLSSRQQILPKEEWMTFEKDVMYLTPFLLQVKMEIQEKKDYEAKVLSYKK